MAFFDKIKHGLKKTRENIASKIDSVIKSFTKIDEEFFEELEELLISGDVGVQTSVEICEKLRAEVKKQGLKEPSEILISLEQIVEDILNGENGLKIGTKPSIILVIGVNGVGKTTTIGKLANQLKNEGKNVLISAADTFRAAATEQLELWANRAGCDIIKQGEGADPAAVVFDSISAARARNVDVIICDTAGRLHNKTNLMGELEKINRIISRELPNADKEILLVLDASTGQNGLSQAVEFKKILNLSGIVLTKLDGTARGGIIIAIKNQLDVPIKFIGVGEGIDDLQLFSAQAFVKALFLKEN